jgi:hypothetical protein
MLIIEGSVSVSADKTAEAEGVEWVAVSVWRVFARVFGTGFLSSICESTETSHPKMNTIYPLRVFNSRCYSDMFLF